MTDKKYNFERPKETGKPEGAGHPHGHHARTSADGTPPLRLVAWEITRSCNLACKHCRAEAHEAPYPGELSTDEAKALIDDFKRAGEPILIFTGGEPMLRQDWPELVEYATARGLRCVMSPNGTLITKESASTMVQAGVQRVSISIDGPDAASHDVFRGVPGAFAASMQGIEHLKQAGMEFQINTTVTKGNLGQFKEIFTLCENLGAVAWHIFLLVPTGRGESLGQEVITAKEYEDVLNWFYDFQKTTDMQLKATCAPHYHRILRQRAKEDGTAVTFENFGLDAVSRGCLGGVGFCFVSHVGQVQPCGYLTLNCGNIHDTPFPEIWKNSTHFKEFRDQSAFMGKCGVCEYHKVCAGCRARAYTMDNNHLAEEPLCSYTPVKMQAREK